MLFAISITYSNLLGQCNIIGNITLNVTDTNATVVIDTVMRMSIMRYNQAVISNSDMLGWTFIAVTKSGTNGKIYINGNLESSGAWQNVGYNLYDIYIGRDQYYGNQYFKGWLDELLISNYEKSASEILSDYNSTSQLNDTTTTIALWHFDETSGNPANEKGGSGTMYGGPVYTQGKFGNAMYFDGVNDYGKLNQNAPENNFTYEFWIKFDGIQLNVSQCPLEPWLYYTTEYYFKHIVDTISQVTIPIWSTGDTAFTTTIDPNIDTLVWVNNGICIDTMIFANSYQEIYDTLVYIDTNYISVTDTLIIDAVLTGVNPPNNVNTIKIYPNPAKTHIYINNGDYNSMNGYSIKINNMLGQTVYSKLINQQIEYIDLSDWTGNGIYIVYIIDNQSNIVNTKKIIIQ